MPRYRFPGYTTFLQHAALRIGRPEAEGPARRITTLSALGNLCAQAGEVAPERVPAIMAKAAEFRDQLHAAYEAAELMLEVVNQALSHEPQPVRVETRPHQQTGPKAKNPDAGRRRAGIPDPSDPNG